MSLSVTNFGVMRGQHNAIVSAMKNQICLEFADQTSPS